MRAGTLRQRVTIQEKPPVSQDSYGAEAPGWAAVATVWARVETLSGREFISRGQEQAEVSHKVTIRFRDGVAPTMRLAWGGRRLEILSVLSDNVRRELLLMCSEEVTS